MLEFESATTISPRLVQITAYAETSVVLVVEVDEAGVHGVLAKAEELELVLVEVVAVDVGATENTERWFAYR